MKAYEDPTIETLGTVAELTQEDKCGGSGDAFFRRSWPPDFEDPHCE